MYPFLRFWVVYFEMLVLAEAYHVGKSLVVAQRLDSKKAERSDGTRGRKVKSRQQLSWRDVGRNELFQALLTSVSALVQRGQTSYKVFLPT